ncbi:MAG: transcriptional repressor [Clostridiales bacterium]|jgi:Fur family ferric uptake transcriptional regulator|nr:transcriptional repressor [Clostridiales bacterium]
MPDNEERFKRILRDNGLKVTSQRLMILEALRKRPDKHLTAEEIYELVKAKNPDIGLATIYRTIQLLSELNLIDKLNIGDGQVRYEIGQLDKDDNIHHHHHLICLNCEKILTFEDDLLDQLEDTIEKTMNFKVVDHEVKLFGYCSECADKDESKED